MTIHDIQPGTPDQNAYTERVARRRYATQAEARADLFDYIEVFYNRQRRHSLLQYRSPAAYENELNGLP